MNAIQYRTTVVGFYTEPLRSNPKRQTEKGSKTYYSDIIKTMYTFFFLQSIHSHLKG